MEKVKKVVIIGPESTGKSTLCELLAKHFKGRFCPEFAREYLLKNGTDYTYEDLLVIAKGQIALENEAVATAQKAFNESGRQSKVFLDTDMYVMKVWCEFVFGKCHPYILEQIAARKYDLYLLCKPDLPWVKDELREYPDLERREQLYGIYKNILENQSTPWVEISGDYTKRLATGIEAVNKLLI